MSKKHLFEPLQKEAVGVISMALVLDPRKHSEAIKELKAIDEADLKEALKISKVKLPVAVAQVGCVTELNVGTAGVTG